MKRRERFVVYGLMSVLTTLNVVPLLTSTSTTAQADPWVPDDDIDTLTKTLDEHAVTYTSDIWPNTHHGFCFPQRPAYVEDAAEKVWDIVFDLYNRKLT